MLKCRSHFFILVFVLQISACANDEINVLRDKDLEEEGTEYYKEDFEPLISMDSLLRIEEELNEKLEEFQQRKDPEQLKN